jgi:hypothetical protein
MPFKYYIIYMKPLYRQNNHYIGKSTTSRLTYRLVTKSVPCRLDSTYRLENLDCKVIPGECVVPQHKLVVVDFRFRVRLQRSKSVQAPRTMWWKLKEEAAKMFKERVLKEDP